MGRRGLSPEDVAAGRGSPGVAELFALIHRVNPTDRGLSEHEEGRRYALKAALQSRLIREWGDHLELTIDEAEVISISHRGHRRDAAHVPLSALDPDVRALVAVRLELPETEREAEVVAGPDRVPPAARDPLSRGRRALEAWDYDEARTCFEDAYRRGAAEEAAFALVELLVEHLGLDRDALDLDLPERVLTPRVARLVALAAARSGELRRAEALLKRLDGTAEAEIRVPLAEHCLKEADTAGTRAHLQALRELDPGNAAVLRIADGLRVLEAQGWAAEEDALEQARAAGDPAGIRAAAEALREVAPAHPAAARALRDLDEAAARRDGERALDAAHKHEASGRLDLALRALDRARASGLDVGAEQTRVRAAATAAEAAARVDAAARSALAGALDPYVALSAAERSQVRQRCEAPRLDDLDAVLAERLRHPVRAAQALGDARAALEAGDAVGTREALEAGGLVGLRCAREVEGGLALLQQQQRRERALEVLSALRRALDGDDDDAAAPLLEALEPEDLPADERARSAGALAALRRRLDDRAEVERFDGFVRAGALFQARTVAEARAADGDPAWSARLDALTARFRGLFPHRVVSGPDLEGAIEPPVTQLSADVCVEPGGRHAWLVESQAWFTFLRRVEVASSRAVEGMVLRTPHMLQLPRILVTGDVVGLGAAAGRFGGFQRGDDGSLLRMIVYEGQSPQGTRAEYVDLGRDPRILPLVRLLPEQEGGEVGYLAYHPGNRGSTVTDVINGALVHLRGQGDRVLIQQASTGRVVLHDREARSWETLGYANEVVSAVAHPTRDGVICVGRFPPHADTRGVALLDGSSKLPRHRVGLALPPGPTPIGAARSPDLIVVLARPSGGARPVLAGLDGDLGVRWRWSGTGPVHLLTDPDDEHLVLAMMTRRGLRLIPLGTEAPDLPDDGVEPQRYRELGEQIAGVGGGLASVAHSDPYREALAAAIAAADRASTPAAAVEALQAAAVWVGPEVQSRGRLARACLDWEDGPWTRRLRGIAAFHEAWGMHAQLGQSSELTDLGRRLPDTELASVAAECLEWLEAESDAMGLLRISAERPQWPGG